MVLCVKTNKEKIRMDKIKFTTTFEKELLKELKIQAVKENCSVSYLLEKLTKEYLEKVSKK
jgi:uncharacterized OsmC-like protein